MNNLAFWIYCIGMVDDLKMLFVGSIIVFTTISGISLFHWLDSKILNSSGSDKILKVFVASLIVVVLSTGAFVVIPSSNTLSAMLLLPKIVDNPRVSDIGNTGMELIETKMQEWLKDMKSKLPESGK